MCTGLHLFGDWVALQTALISVETGLSSFSLSFQDNLIRMWKVIVPLSNHFAIFPCCNNCE